MGKRGPTRTPTDELAARGSWLAKQPDRQHEVNVEPLDKTPAPPDWLSDDAAAMWREYAPAACDEGMLTRLELPVFALFCENLAEYVALRRVLDEEGYTVKTEHYTGAHPAAKLMGESRKSLISLAEKCGHTMASRIGLVLKGSRDSKKAARNVAMFAKG